MSFRNEAMARRLAAALDALKGVQQDICASYQCCSCSGPLQPHTTPRPVFREGSCIGFSCSDICGHKAQGR